jgi:hypothetical protein
MDEDVLDLPIVAEIISRHQIFLHHMDSQLPERLIEWMS